ncbi:family 78 glycoside hydrolase catalytic domain [Jiangella asiatica]|uniref:alpha-L-rhamnosidase n=1 Tax=Jiangella asiatica TaxID=2530372 RepID=A0A4V2Z425_9ACTN|nr:family 78 glycoside hydrolase catalytic domain [Jiangella asiatica]TDE15058.1 hydrolase [Jiangella asiatica]
MTDTTVEYAHNPLGVDAPHPLLSWVLESPERAQVQSAYRLQVASTEDRLTGGRPDVWDSGWVSSSQSVNVAYAGPSLESGARYFWRVQVADGDGDRSGWSEPAWWEMGLLDESDWEADWIGMPEGPNNPAGASWIWTPEGDPATSVAAGTRYFRRTLELSAQPVERAMMVLAADDAFVLHVNGTEAARSHTRVFGGRMAIEVDLADLLTAGSNTLAVSARNRYVGPAGLVAKLEVELADGQRVEVLTDSSWRVSRRNESGWDRPGFDDSEWSGAREVAAYGEGPWPNQVRLRPTHPPAPLLRKEFTVTKPVSRARLYVSGLGYGTYFLNGERIGDRVLDPAFTDYNRRVLYSTYDVTNQLEPGANAFGAELGRGHLGFVLPAGGADFVDDTKMLMQLEVEYTDGTTQTVASDGTWQVTEGPTVYDNIATGETYDARREQPGWATPGFEATDWSSAAVLPPPAPVLRAQSMPPITATDIEPVRITEPKPGVHVFDMGRTTAGWARLSVSGAAGTAVRMLYGEELNDDGTVRNLGHHDPERSDAAGQLDIYILNGKGREVWEPEFSYTGFQYVQVEGLPEPPTTDTITGREVHNAVDSVGAFESSNELYGQIHDAMRATILNNLQSMPTDSPTFERRGWSGDAHVALPTMLYNFDMAAFFKKWLDDFEDNQVDTAENRTDDRERGLGRVTVVAPWPNDFRSTSISAAWTGVLPALVWSLYTDYGDRTVLTDHYAFLTRYMDFMETLLDDGIMSVEQYGDHASPFGSNPEEDRRLAGTAYFYKSLREMARIATVLGEAADAERYDTVAEHVRDRFNAVFFDRDGGYYDTFEGFEYKQTSNAVPLAFGLVPEEHEASVVQSLVDDIEARGWHLNTGILGTSVLLPVLSEHGHHDVAHRLAGQTTDPSWGHWIENGMTTIPSRWPMRPGSNNHYMLGTVDEWFYSHVAGLSPDPSGPGYEKFVVRPYPGGVDEAKTTYESVRGEIETEWEHDDDIFRLEVTVPVNATATVHVPTSDPGSVTEGGGPADRADGVRFLEVRDGYAVYVVGSGEYRFHSEIQVARTVNQ